MRLSTAIGAVALTIGSAAAQTSSYYAERGHWLVSSTPDSCIALNRPPEEFNASPYNALQIVAEHGFLIGADVFFWPGAVQSERAYELAFFFDSHDPVTLPAVPEMWDFMLSVEPAQHRDLWRHFQDARRVQVAVVGEDSLTLTFVLDSTGWVMDKLRNCLSILPPPS